MPRKKYSPLQGICADIVVPNIALSIGRRKRKDRPSQADSSAVRQRRREERADNSSETGIDAPSELSSDHDEAQAAGYLEGTPAERQQQQACMSIDTFICLLKIKPQERCIIVSSNAEGAQCIATATPKPGSPDTLLVQLCTAMS